MAESNDSIIRLLARVGNLRRRENGAKKVLLVAQDGTEKQEGI